MTAEDAIEWVDQNAKKIAGHSRKYLPYAPYDQEDFLQDAYEAALEAAKVSMDRQIFFPACFWNLYKGKISAVTPNPVSKSKAVSSAPSLAYCDSFDFTSKQFAQEDNTCHLESQFNINIDQAYPFVRDHLTAKEEQILEPLLGIHGGTMKIKEAARHLECSPANVRQALNRACQRISTLVASGELDAGFVETEIMKQFEGMPETEKPVTNRTAKPDTRSDVPSSEGSQNKQPRRHQGSHSSRKTDLHRSTDTKTHQTIHRNTVVAMDTLWMPSVNVIAIPGSSRGVGILGTTPTWKDFVDLQAIGRIGSHYDFSRDDTTVFVAGNPSSIERSVVHIPQREGIKAPVDNVITLSERRISLAPDPSQNSRNGPVNISPSNARSVPPPGIAKRKRKIKIMGRNGPTILFTDRSAEESFDAQVQLHLAA